MILSTLTPWFERRIKLNKIVTFIRAKHWIVKRCTWNLHDWCVSYMSLFFGMKLIRNSWDMKLRNWYQLVTFLNATKKNDKHHHLDIISQGQLCTHYLNTNLFNKAIFKGVSVLFFSSVLRSKHGVLCLALHWATPRSFRKPRVRILSTFLVVQHSIF